MKPWAIWMIHHRMAWLLKALVIASYPLQLLYYCSDAFDDVLYTVRTITIESQK